MHVESTGSPRKWDRFWAEYQSTSYASNYGALLYEQEALAALKALEGLPPGARILSLGTGLGQVERHLLADLVCARGNVLVCADLIPSVLSHFFRHAKTQAPQASLSAVTCDAYNLPFPDSSFNAVISFGNACVASYKGVAPELARVVRPGGIVVMDFINHLSAYQLVRPSNWRRFLKFLGVISGGAKYHHFGRLSIRSFYSRHGLVLQKLEHLCRVPPLRNVLSVARFRQLDALWPFGRVFGAVLVGTFRKE